MGRFLFWVFIGIPAIFAMTLLAVLLPAMVLGWLVFDESDPENWTGLQSRLLLTWPVWAPIITLSVWHLLARSSRVPITETPLAYLRRKRAETTAATTAAAGAASAPLLPPLPPPRTRTQPPTPPPARPTPEDREEMDDESDDEFYSEDDTCPYCGGAVLYRLRGSLECPNCGSSF